MRVLRPFTRGFRAVVHATRPGLRLRLLPSVLVLALLLGATAALFVLTRDNLAHNEHALLRTRLRDTARVVETLSHDTALAMRDAGHVAGLVHGDPAAFERLVRPDVVSTSLSSVSLLRFHGVRGAVVASVGSRPPLLPRRFGSFDWVSARRTAATVTPAPFKVGFVAGSLVISYVEPVQDLPGYGLYGEIYVDDVVRRAFSAAGGAEGALDGALYYGTIAEPLALIAANTRALPFHGAQISQVVRLGGGGQALLVVHPRRPLVAGLTAQAPWIALAAGLLLSIGLTALVELIRRRHDRALALLRDLSRAHGELALSERRFRELFEQATDVVFTLDLGGVLTSINDVGTEAFGRARAELVGEPLAGLLAEPDARRLEEQRLRAVSGSLDEMRLETEVGRNDGDAIAIDLRIRPISADGDVVGFQGIGRDVTERLALEERLSYQAFHDPLTGLANRALLLDRIELALAEARRPGEAALVLIDLDDFKTVNDSLGHEAGDGLLQAAAERIATVSPQRATCARLGGDEFAILLRDIGSVDEATDVARAVAAALERPFELAGREAFVRASVGIAVTGEGDEEAALLRNADVAMYQAKGRRAGTRWEVFSADMLTAAKERLTLGADLKQALARNEFELVYQPIVDCRDGRLVAVEALLRWRHRERGVLAPAAFIGLAEETGLIVEIGGFVVDEACRQVAEWQDTVPGLDVAINVSGRQLHEPGFAEEICGAIGRAGLRPGQVVLEITESVLLNDAPGGPIIADLRSRGVRIAVDDFGSGHSSLDFLRRFPVDILKIDGRYVDSTGGADDLSLLHSIVRLAQSLRLATVVEGVETHEQQLLVQHVESTFAQGFFYSRPLSATDLRRSLRTVWLDPAGAGRPAPRRIRTGRLAAAPSGEPVA